MGEIFAAKEENFFQHFEVMCRPDKDLMVFVVLRVEWRVVFTKGQPQSLFRLKS
jgi:hypothetical protein